MSLSSSIPRRVLLVEPPYANKYPPIGLMKIATYFRNRGDEVTFFKGDLRELVLARIVEKCVEECQAIDPSIDWPRYRDHITDFVRTRKTASYEKIEFSESPFNFLLQGKIVDAKNSFWRGTWKSQPEWDLVFVTTLFTFYWDLTVETILFAKTLVKQPQNLWVGGVLASLQPDELFKATGVRPHVGVLGAGAIDPGDPTVIDELPLDYSILDETDYSYPMSDAYYGYTSRGCIRHCAFCAVSTLEPHFVPHLPLLERVRGIRERYGEQRDLLLMDNNVLASPAFPDIIGEIKACGFGRGATMVPENPLALAYRNLEQGLNDRAYTRRVYRLIHELYDKIKNHPDEGYRLYHLLDTYSLKSLSTTSKQNLLAAKEEMLAIQSPHFHPAKRQRYVDFNQGIDARLLTEQNVGLLASIAIRPLRIAFDDLCLRDTYCRGVRMAAEAGIGNFSNYLLYNFRDHPDDLYQRLRINVDLCEQLDVAIYSFPMKYHPLRREEGWEEDFSHNRDYIGPKWNRKYIRAIQAVLNSTKGKVGRGVSFFEKAFGKDLSEYRELLEMPEPFILYRFFFQWLDDQPGQRGTGHWRGCWRQAMAELDGAEKKALLDLVHSNQVRAAEIERFPSPVARELLSYYLPDRNEVERPGSELHRLKQIYDLNPTIKLKRRGQRGPS